MIVIDIVTDITDVETLRAAKPEIQSIMPTDQNKIDSWWEDTLIKNTERLTKRHFGYLKEKSKALHKAKQLVPVFRDDGEPFHRHPVDFRK